MPMILFKKLKLGDLKATNMILKLVDLSITHPYRVIEDVLVDVDGLVFPTNFVIVDINEHNFFGNFRKDFLGNRKITD